MHEATKQARTGKLSRLEGDVDEVRRKANTLRASLTELSNRLIAPSDKLTPRIEGAVPESSTEVFVNRVSDGLGKTQETLDSCEAIVKGILQELS
jgi:predicted transcriptional regulator